MGIPGTFTAIVSLPFGGQENHGPVVFDFENWCDESYLCWNVSKPKAFSIDLKKKEKKRKEHSIGNC